MEGLLKRFEENLKLRNYSKQTIKSYLNHVKKYLEFAEGKGVNVISAKDFLLKKLSKNEPSSIGHNVFALKYWTSNFIMSGSKDNSIKYFDYTSGTLVRNMIGMANDV